VAEGAEGVRLDRWLWAARFFKTRSRAVEAIQGGRVHLEGTRAKPSREVRAGDRLDITIGESRWTVVVTGVSERRGPAGDAAQLYEETPESRERRARRASERRLAPAFGADLEGRPTKRDRRRIEAFRRARGDR
jgi:ribosome-associated heat shock protein Hsp15